MSKITEADKVDIRTSASLRINKYEAADFNELKASLNALYNVTGWANYADSVASTINVTSANTLITNNKLGANTNETYLPLEIRGSGTLFAGNKITPIRLADAYDVRFNLTISAKSGNPTLIDFILDIGGLATPTIQIAERILTAEKSAPYSTSFTIPIFALATFIANGGQLFAKVDTGSITISNRSIFITRTHSEV